MLAVKGGKYLVVNMEEEGEEAFWVPEILSRGEKWRSRSGIFFT